LRELCKRTLAFENHYLSIYREYLLAQLRREDEDSRLFAVKRLGETIYADEETIDVLQEAEAARSCARPCKKRCRRCVLWLFEHF